LSYDPPQKIIHRLWIGPNPIPEPYVEYGKRWAELNPGWEVREWTEADVEEMGLTNRRIWDHIKEHGGNSSIAHNYAAARATQMADVAGYEIVYRHGGVYLNCDMEPLRPLADLPADGGDAWACLEVDHWLNNGALGGPAGHPFWKLVIDELPRRWDRMPGRPMHIVTGPHLLTEIAYGVGRRRITILPNHLFNYVLYDKIDLGGDASAFRQAACDAGAISLHHWSHRTAAMRTDVS
jgi:mannosyltransferase OCH1-like enzyme